jgi:hypothetical protein
VLGEGVVGREAAGGRQACVCGAFGSGWTRRDTSVGKRELRGRRAKASGGARVPCLPRARARPMAAESRARRGEGAGYVPAAGAGGDRDPRALQQRRRPLEAGPDQQLPLGEGQKNSRLRAVLIESRPPRARAQQSLQGRVRWRRTRHHASPAPRHAAVEARAIGAAAERVGGEGGRGGGSPAPPRRSFSSSSALAQLPSSSVARARRPISDQSRATHRQAPPPGRAPTRSVPWCVVRVLCAPALGARVRRSLSLLLLLLLLALVGC